MSTIYEAVVAGHTCMDLLPGFLHGGKRIEQVLVPGRLLNTGALISATGGAVPNTGGALHRLGIRTLLMGKVGDDDLGHAILGQIASRGTSTDGMIVDRKATSSYSIVLSIPGIDRIPLHYPGPNDTFGPGDLDYEAIGKVRLFHFGYPPLMRRFYSDGGANLARMFRKVKRMGVTTSLDMARPDPNAPSGRVDWIALLERVLPQVDCFFPSIDELVYMLDRKGFSAFEKKATQGVPLGGLKRADLTAMADQLLSMGAGLVAIKLGSEGLFVKTSVDAQRLHAMGAGAPKDVASWTGCELHSPCYKVKLVGAIGAGDCTIAGLLAGLLRGQKLEDAVNSAVGTGACNVEAADALSGVPSWAALQRRIKSRWPKRLPEPGWRAD